MSYFWSPYLEMAGSIQTGPLEPNPPLIVSVEQAQGYVVVGILPAAVSGPFVPYQFRLYRTDPQGHTVQVYQTRISPTSLENLLFDTSPTLGVKYTYYATALDILGNESDASNTVQFATFNPTLFVPFTDPRNITPSAYGPYPVLGNDFYLDPVNRDIVVGPNGDYLTVSGLECLAQDLRNHILTEVGELVLHPDFGFQAGSIIGSGQADPQTQAQILNTRVRDVLGAEPRVQSVIDVQISQPASDQWTITYIIMAIGVEDPQTINAVIPFMSGGTRSVPSNS